MPDIRNEINIMTEENCLKKTNATEIVNKRKEKKRFEMFTIRAVQIKQSLNGLGQSCTCS